MGQFNRSLGIEAMQAMNGRVCMLTGASGGMGGVIATELARQGATVILVVRRPEIGAALQRQVVAATQNREVHVLSADLSSQAAIRTLAAEFHRQFKQLHVLIHNAGALLRTRAVSVDGIEMHFAINYLAPFLLTNLLLETLAASGQSRVVNVVSETMKDASLDLSDLQGMRGTFRPMQAYARAKLALLMSGYRLARIQAGTRVTVNALHPGVVATGMADDIVPTMIRPFLGLIKALLLSPERGAESAIHLATSPSLDLTTGKYFVKKKERHSPPISYDIRLQEQLYEASAALVGLPG